MKKILVVLLSLAMIFGLAGCGQKEEAKEETSEPTYSGTVVVYSPHDADPLAAGIALFEEAYPGITVEKVAAGTGELGQRIIAEANNPVADVFWGGGADSLANYVDYFEPYVCANDAVIDEAFKDADDLWIGESPLPMVFIYSKTALEAAGLTVDDVPTTWEGLCDPKLKGHIAYCSPAKSGSAYTQLCTMLFASESMDAGWDMVKNFIANLDGKMLDSSGKCHKLVAEGEFAIGVTIEKSAVLYNDNPDMGFVYPKKNSAVPDGVALIKNCPNPENAKLFIDFVTGLECQKDQNENWKRRPVRTDLSPVGLDELSTLDLCDYDFAYAGANKEAIIEQFNDLVSE